MIGYNNDMIVSGLLCSTPYGSSVRESQSELSFESTVKTQTSFPNIGNLPDRWDPRDKFRRFLKQSVLLAPGTTREVLFGLI